MAIALAFLLWLQVTSQSEIVKEKEFTVPVTYSGKADTLALLDQPEFIKVVVSGPTSLVDRVESNTIRPVVKLDSKKAGEHRSPILLTDTPQGLTAKLSRNEANFRLESIRRTSRQVEVEVRGNIPSDLRYDGATTAPETVSISGPSSRIEEVRKVRVMLDLSNLKPGAAPKLLVEVLGNSNVPISNVIVDPAQVDVFPAISAATSSANALVVPAWKGTPAFGFRVDQYELTPKAVKLVGDRAEVAKVQIVNTEPIDLSGARSDLTGRARIIAPQGVQVDGDAEVGYYIRIVPDRRGGPR